MNEENNEPKVPNFEGEAMKMPENNRAQEVGEKKPSSIVNAPLLFTLAVLLVVILGGMFYWFNSMTSEAIPIPSPVVERPTPEENNEPESTTAEAQVETMQAVSTSDELSAIESDLEGTMLDEIDAEINAIELELNNALE